MAKDKAHPEQLREEAPDPSDDLVTADAKSGSVDERVPESFGVDGAAGLDAPAPAAGLPQAGIGIGRPVEDMGPGEAVLEKEREHLRIPKQPG
jgi:hypothetical protein